MANKYELRTIIRQRSARVISDAAFDLYCHLADGQPLLLVPEPSNPVDGSAVMVTDLMSAPCGYVAREHAAEVAAKIAEGWVLLAKTVGRCQCIQRNIFIWSEGEAEREVESEFKLPAPKNKNKVLVPADDEIGKHGSGERWEEPNDPNRRYV